jgi:L-ascorbate metabolism protein UlaG (beta-lactamase superfamily)
VCQVVQGDEVKVRGVVVRATAAQHGGRSWPGRSPAALGYAILGYKRVYFAGDTDLFDDMAGLVHELDLALIPIWGWGPTLGPGHLDPERAAEAVRRLRPRMVVPIHWGTLRPLHVSRRAAYLREPAETFAELVRERAPETEVRVLRPGQATEF